MKIRLFLLFMGILLLVPQVNYSQINPLKRASQKLSEKIEQGLSEKKSTASETDTINQDVKNKEDVKVSETASPGSRFTFGGGAASVPHKERYNYTGRLVMEMTIFDKGKPSSKIDYVLYFDKNQGDVGTETKMFSTTDDGDIPIESTMVIDNTNKSMIVVSSTDGQRMGIISSLEEAMEDMAEEETATTKITRTGRSKVINGYKCEEYKAEEIKDPRNYSLIWVTKEMKYPVSEKEMKASGMRGYTSSGEFEGGLFMEMEVFEKGEIILRSQTKEINEKYPHTISVEGVTLIKMRIPKSRR